MSLHPRSGRLLPVVLLPREFSGTIIPASWSPQLHSSSNPAFAGRQRRGRNRAVFHLLGAAPPKKIRTKGYPFAPGVEVARWKGCENPVQNKRKGVEKMSPNSTKGGK